MNTDPLMVTSMKLSYLPNTGPTADGKAPELFKPTRGA
jgi:hypothetical protein